ncbi:MAG: hypothetical protein OXG44_17855 [Gammaproteobacteria bacterium]|nr:hypothetical protein [Gammaproteobacteria bacterium]MDE0192012.1 hypothetical protein [Gammaproteobacteria bacterium]
MDRPLSLLNEKLLGLPFGTATVEELLRSGLLEPDAIYRRREIVEALRNRFVELGGTATTTAQEVIVPLKRVLAGPLFEKVRSGFYRYVGASPGSTPKRRSFEPPQAGTPSGTAEPWRSELDRAATESAIVAILRSQARQTVADRIDYLHGLARDDPEEQPIALESLRRMTHFLLGHGDLPDPEVGTSPNGFAQVEWILPDASPDQAGNGLLAMEFTPSPLVRFAALSAPFSPGADRLTVHGTLPADETFGAVRAFTAGLVTG